MNPTINEIRERMARLEEEFEAELQRRRLALQADFQNRRVHFEEAVLARQRRFKAGLLGYVLGAELRHVVSMPFVFSLIVPMVFLDLLITVYQRVCFPLFRITIVRRRDCWVFDRTHLAYLNLLEKINCAYCSYANGLAAYFSEIAGRTEQYWCPIKHSQRVLHAHSRYAGFLDFGDAEAYRQELKSLRDQLLALDPTKTH